MSVGRLVSKSPKFFQFVTEFPNIFLKLTSFSFSICDTIDLASAYQNKTTSHLIGPYSAGPNYRQIQDYYGEVFIGRLNATVPKLTPSTKASIYKSEMNNLIENVYLFTACSSRETSWEFLRVKRPDRKWTDWKVSESVKQNGVWTMWDFVQTTVWVWFFF